ncbi:MAG TPA: ATP-binding cassette domain-containing protein, partial [Pseudomonas sp.]|nr:ATP-binding cassette domain-containing protein [Pseudomonas sp.]
AVENLDLWLPGGKRLISGLDLQLEAGDSLLIRAPSGYGKSTLVRAITGIWEHASGTARYDLGSVLTLSQKTYLPLGSLRDMLWYPHPAQPGNDAQLQHYMQQCGLEHLVPKLDEEVDWSQILSLGEQQRCAFVRALLSRPSVLFLDESTSALDEATEAQCYALLKRELSDTILISIGHRASLERFHAQLLELKGVDQESQHPVRQLDAPRFDTAT